MKKARTLRPVDFPAGLCDLADPPSRLFVRGAIPAGRAVAIIGTRRSTRYGREVAGGLGAAVAAAGWVVVSGLARGIDSAAHRGVVEVGGRGVAFLGSGIDVWYPPENRGLGESLFRHGGGVVSEYPAGSPPEPWRFPVRNRLIAAMAEAVVVVEAGVTGGALITARLALELGREVLAVPGDIDRPASVGCNLLIKDGATPVLGVDDLLESLGWSRPITPPEAGLGSVAERLAAATRAELGL